MKLFLMSVVNWILAFKHISSPMPIWYWEKDVDACGKILEKSFYITNHGVYAVRILYALFQSITAHVIPMNLSIHLQAQQINVIYWNR